MKHLILLNNGFGLNSLNRESPKLINNTPLKENEFNRNVSKKIYDILENYKDLDVVILNTEKSEISIEEKRMRANIFINNFNKKYGINSKKILISINLRNNNDGKWNDKSGTTIKCKHSDTCEFPKIIHEYLHNYTKLNKNELEFVSNDKLFNISNLTTCVNCYFAGIDNKKEFELIINNKFRNQCAEGIVHGLLKFLEIPKSHKLTIDKELYKDGNISDISKDSVELNITPNHEYVIKSKPLDLELKLMNCKIKDLKITNCINGMFSNSNDSKPNGILVKNGKIINNNAINFDTLKSPQGVFIIYNNGEVILTRAKHADELKNLNNIKLAFGGIVLFNKLNNRIVFNPKYEGFRKDKDIDTTSYLSDGNKTILGYNKNEDKVIIITKHNTSLHNYKDLINNTIDIGCDMGILLNNNPFIKKNGEFIFKSTDEEHIINNIIKFK